MNKWCRGQAAVPAWAGLLAALLQEHSPEALTITLEEAIIILEETQRPARASTRAEAHPPALLLRLPRRAEPTH